MCIKQWSVVIIMMGFTTKLLDNSLTVVGAVVRYIQTKRRVAYTLQDYH